MFLNQVSLRNSILKSCDVQWHIKGAKKCHGTKAPRKTCLGRSSLNWNANNPSTWIGPG